MWHSPQTLNRTSSALIALAVGVLLYGAARVFLGMGAYALQTLTISHPGAPALQRVTRAQIAEIAENEIRGNFFSVEMTAVQAAFEKLPWVRSAQVRRQWPAGLEVELVEHVALARWNQHGNVADDETLLLNTHGEVFNARSDEKLPSLSGPPAAAAEVAQQYRRLQAMLEPLRQRIDALDLSKRRAWRVELAANTTAAVRVAGITLKLGRAEQESGIEKRLARYIAAQDYMQKRFAEQRVAYVDLRYAQGFAVRVVR